MTKEEIFSKDNLLKYTPMNVIKFSFSMAFLTFCLVFIIMMAKAADIPLGKLFDYWIAEATTETNHDHSDILERLEAVEALSHEEILR